MGPPPFLSENEDQVSVRWISDCSREGFPQKKLSVQLSVKQFLTVNQRKTRFKDNTGSIEHSFAAILCFPLALMKCNLIHCHTGSGRYQQMANKLFIIVDFLGSCLFLLFRYKLQQVEDVLKEEKSLDILLDPTRIFNGVE
jgi:hypothetical protein